MKMRNKYMNKQRWRHIKHFLDTHTYSESNLRYIHHWVNGMIRNVSEVTKPVTEDTMNIIKFPEKKQPDVPYFSERYIAEDVDKWIRDCIRDRPSNMQHSGYWERWFTRWFSQFTFPSKQSPPLSKQEIEDLKASERDDNGDGLIFDDYESFIEYLSASRDKVNDNEDNQPHQPHQESSYPYPVTGTNLVNSAPCKEQKNIDPYEPDDGSRRVILGISNYSGRETQYKQDTIFEIIRRFFNKGE